MRVSTSGNRVADRFLSVYRSENPILVFFYNGFENIDNNEADKPNLMHCMVQDALAENRSNPASIK
jgi:hypothetical protein